MHFSLVSLLSLAGLVAQASAHGLVKKPVTREPGQATEAACGKIMADFYRADNTSYPEALLRANPGGLKAPYDPKKCNLWLCKGYQFADNAANVQSYKAGQVLDLEVWIRIAHKGFANVSVVDTASNSVIGTPLISWPDNYAASTSPPANQTKFSITVPELGDKCTVAGACVSTVFQATACSPFVRLVETNARGRLQVIQWYWLGQGQTYESCIDFTVAAAADHGHMHRMRGQSWV